MTRAEVGAGAFFVDLAGSKLHIGDNPGGHTVEASVRVLALSLQFGSGASVVRGLGFVHFAPNYSSAQGGAIISNVAGNTFENNTFAYNSNRGLVVYGANTFIRGNNFLYNGEGGFGGYHAHGSVIEGNYIGHNNTAHFKLRWDANGAKFASTQNLLWKNNLVEYNIGGGLWCDSDCDNNIFVGNTVRYNSKWNGIIVEIATSSGGIIAGNLVYGNEGTGISMSGSGNIKVYNNTTAMNGSDIAVSGCAVGNVVKNNIMSGNSTTLYNASGGLFFLNCPTYIAGQALLAASDYNAYYRAAAAAPYQTLIYWGKSGFNSLAAFQQAIALDAHSISIDNNPVNPFFKDELNGDYSLKIGSAARGKGEPLPQDVANAMGMAAGVPVDMGAFQNPLDMRSLLMPPRAPSSLAFR